MATSVLSAEAMRHFDKWGYVRVPQALSEEFVENVRQAVWQELAAQHGMVETDPATWPPRLLGVTINKDKIDAFAGTEVTGRLAGAIDQLLGQGQWRPIRTFGGLLMTIPEAQPQAWEVVHKDWHFDNDPGAYVGNCNELMLFTFYSHVEAQGGGTLALAGSHRLAEAWVQADAITQYRVQDLLRLAKWHPYLAQLQGTQPSEYDNAQWMGRVTQVHGTDVYVAEFTGEPGDAILCHPALFHAASRNASARPRIMRRTNVRRLKGPG